MRTMDIWSVHDGPPWTDIMVSAHVFFFLSYCLKNLLELSQMKKTTDLNHYGLDQGFELNN